MDLFGSGFRASTPLLGRVSQQCPRAVARAKEVAASVELRPDGVSGSSGLSAGGHVSCSLRRLPPQYVHLPIDRIPGHTFPEHPNILYTSFSAYEEVQYRTSPFHTSLACSSGQAPRPIGRASFRYPPLPRGACSSPHAQGWERPPARIQGPYRDP